VKKLLSFDVLSALLVFTCMLKLNLPVVFGVMLQLMALNAPTVTLCISCVLFGMVQVGTSSEVLYCMVAVKGCVMVTV